MSLKNKVGLIVAVQVAFLISCKKDEKKKEVEVSTQLRSMSTGSLAIETTDTPPALASLLTDSPIGNSAVTVELFELPIGRINLTSGDTGSGYTEASPNFYTCPGTTNADCMVDIANTNLNDLLQGNSGSQTISAEDEKTYTGTSIEICAEGAGGPGTTFKARIKASGKLGSDTYYTNATTGVSKVGPAEAIEITMDCGGLNTDLTKPITVTPETTLNLVFWADPTGGIFLTNNGALANATCFDSTAGVITFCATKPAVFGTTVAGNVTAEQYQLDVKTIPTVGGDFYGDVLVTVVTNAEGTAIGAATKQLYTNVSGETKTMPLPLIAFDTVALENGKYSFGYVSQGSTTTVLKGLSQTGTSTGLTLNILTGSEVEVDAKKL